MTQIHAIRSLLCVDHAVNIPPRVLSLHWFLGKRCNYDCTYCGPHHHDLVSPFVDQSQALAFVERCHDDALSNGKKIKWSFTGGEPFIDPAFFTLVQTISNQSTCEQINVTTNGSLPLDRYQKYLGILDGITISLHLERSLEEQDKTVATAIALHESKQIFISINLMFLPGTMDRVQHLQQKLQEHGVPYIIRRITDQPKDTEYLPYDVEGTGRKQIKLLAVDTQVDTKLQWKDQNDKNKDLADSSYYTPDELAFLKLANDRPVWQNMAVWTNSEYQEINSDLLLSKGLNSFQNWKCFAGVDYLYVDFDGSIYVASCLNGDPVGHISDGSIPFQTAPVICQRKWCICNTEVAIRKCSDDEYLPLISEKR